MKIISTDNFGNSGEQPGFDETLVAIVVNNKTASLIAGLLNDSEKINSRYYYKVVADNYKLLEFEP
jgi:hypothetical protein